MGIRQRKGHEWSIYIRSLLLVSSLVALAAFFQVYFVYKKFEPRFIVIPFLVALSVGMLVGRLAVLRKRLHQKSAEFRAMVDLAQEFTYLRTTQGAYEYVSPYCEVLTGYTQAEFYSCEDLMEKLVHPEDRSRWMDHMQHVNEGGSAENFDIRLVTKSGEVIWVNHLCAPVRDEAGRQIGIRSTNLNVTQRMLDQMHIARVAHYDPLTDLPNRRLLDNDIRQRVEAGNPFSVLFLDLNRFKNINDSLGHALGDRLLQNVAARLRSVCPESSLLCRFGGDEFVIVHPKARGCDSARRLANSLLEEIERPIVIDSNVLHVTGTIGVACFPEDGADTDTLLRNADTAMYRAKRSTGEKIVTYQPDFSRAAAHFVSTESEIYRALKHEEFVIHYQPKVDLATGRIVSLEALARWQHPQRGLLAPGQFIMVMEETGQINELGKQILARVLGDLARWWHMGCAVPVAINISPRQFTDQVFWKQLHEGIHRIGCGSAMLELEITEQVFLADIQTAAERLGGLRAAGFSIALDDFGTGYSSFNYLRQLPISTLKLDRTFVTHVEYDPVSQAILRAMSGISGELGLALVAEGVETEAQRAALLAYGCRLAQGYLFHRPMPPADVEVLLAEPVEASQSRRVF